MSVTVQYVSTSSNDLLVAPNDIIPFSGGVWYSFYDHRIDHSQDVGGLFPVAGGSNSRFFELFDYGTNLFFADNTFGFELRYVLDSGVVKTKIIARSSSNAVPYFIDRNGIGFSGIYAYGSGDSNHPTEFFITPGDVVRGYNINELHLFTFTVTDEMLFRYLHYGDDDPPDDDPPDDDPPENDPPPTPVFVPRSARRGNLNFW